MTIKRRRNSVCISCRNRTGKADCGRPEELRRSLACTNIIENMMGTIRRVTHNVKRWRDAKMALRWTAAGMMEAKKGFRRIRAYRELPRLQAALKAHQKRHQENLENSGNFV